IVKGKVKPDLGRANDRSFDSAHLNAPGPRLHPRAEFARCLAATLLASPRSARKVLVDHRNESDLGLGLTVGLSQGRPVPRPASCDVQPLHPNMVVGLLRGMVINRLRAARVNV